MVRPSYASIGRFISESQQHSKNHGFWLKMLKIEKQQAL